ncbi:hypothetical protein GCG54_00007215, partial [Colletotrichum gloeosporioides]
RDLFALPLDTDFREALGRKTAKRTAPQAGDLAVSAQRSHLTSVPPLSHWNGQVLLLTLWKPLRILCCEHSPITSLTLQSRAASSKTFLRLSHGGLSMEWLMTKFRPSRWSLITPAAIAPSLGKTSSS